MDKFQVIQPSELLLPYIKQYWFLTMENVVQVLQRLVPLGCIALTFHRRNRTYSSLEKDYLPQSYISGITTHYSDLYLSGNIDFICIVFQPAGAKAFFKLPLNELNNRDVSLAEFNDSGLLELEKQLFDTVDNLLSIKLIEQFLYRRICQLDNHDDKRINAVLNSIHNGKVDVDRLAQTACLGYKQFKRIFSRDIGINPKDFLQIKRFQTLHSLLQQHSDMTVAQLAYECGYYDKSHLIKELKDFSGFTPTELLAACDPVYSNYHAFFRSAFIDIPFN